MAKRYKDIEFGMVLSPEGHWVKYEDYEKLKKENEALRKLISVLDDYIEHDKFVAQKEEIEELKKHSCINRCMNRDK